MDEKNTKLTAKMKNFPLTVLAIVLVAGIDVCLSLAVDDSDYVHAERKCWESSGCRIPPALEEVASSVNCYAYESACSPSVKFSFISMPKRGVKAPSCSRYFDCMLDNKVQFCHSGLCRREGTQDYHCERKLRNTRCFGEKRNGEGGQIYVQDRKGRMVLKNVIPL